MRTFRSHLTSWQVCRWLAGLEAGVWAGAAMLGWLALTAAWSRHSIWEAPNRLGALFYGPAARLEGFHAGTWAGAAFLLFTSAVVGLLFGFVARDGRNRVRTRLLGILTGLAWCYLSYAWFWRRLAPSGAALPPPSLLAAYLVFGAVLGCYPGRLRSVQRHFLGQPPAVERGAELGSDGDPAQGEPGSPRQ
jgi:hypothetical protein